MATLARETSTPRSSNDSRLSYVEPRDARGALRGATRKAQPPNAATRWQIVRRAASAAGREHARVAAILDGCEASKGSLCAGSMPSHARL